MREMQVPPHSQSSEAGVICSLIIHPEFYYSVEHLQPNFFYYIENMEVYKAIRSLILKGVTRIDEMNLLTQLNMSTDVDKVFGGNVKEELKKLVDGASYVSRGSIEEYKVLAHEIIGLAFKREAYKKLQCITNKCLTVNVEDIDEINCELIDACNNLATSFITHEEVTTIGNSIDSIYETIKSERNDNGTCGIQTAWQGLRKYFSYRKGELVVIVARRKNGKSVLCCNEAFDKSKAGIPVFVADSEMSTENFTMRLLSHVSQIPEQKIRNGNMTPEESKIVEDSIEYIKTLPLYHKYDSRWTPEKLLTQAKIMKSKNCCEMLIFDYIKNTDGKVHSASELSQSLGNMTNTLKNDIATTLNIPVLAFCQLNRSDMIADSDQIERYASVGLKWSLKTAEQRAKDSAECGNAFVKVLFNRNGESHSDDEFDYMDFNLRGNCLTIEESAQQHSIEETPFDDKKQQE